MFRSPGPLAGQSLLGGDSLCCILLHSSGPVLEAGGLCAESRLGLGARWDKISPKFANLHKAPPAQFARVSRQHGAPMSGG